MCDGNCYPTGGSMIAQTLDVAMGVTTCPSPHKDFSMSPSGHVALAAIAAALAACASSAPPEYTAVDAATTIADVPAYEEPALVSDLDAMRAVLPDFDLRENGDQMSQRGTSIVRDLTFIRESSILSRADVTRLAPLRAYLRANPSIAVRITGYGDGFNSAGREADLSLSRAQAVARALLTDINVTNSIDAMGALMPQQKQYFGRAEIVFTRPVESHDE
jgi:outer membrane protein OmpA-like peptidoglycan-associated protein